MKTFEEVFAVLKALQDIDVTPWFGVDSTDSSIYIYLNANDFFYWGCADAEEIAVKDLDLLNKCIEDCIAAGVYDCCAEELFLCRKRGMRPQIPVFNRMDPILKEIIGREFPDRDGG